MPRTKLLTSGWRGAALVGITYVDFLIFAQFAFLKRLAELGIASEHLKAVMAAMAAGGILFSLITPRLNSRLSPAFLLRAGFVTSSAAAFLSLLPLGFAAAITVAAFVGSGLGVVTVTIVTHLSNWTGSRNALLPVAIGTGLGYFACNFPPLFTAAPETQALVAGALCVAALAIPLAPAPGIVEREPVSQISFLRVLTAFTALVWLDSAAFFIIQNTPHLKSATWQGTPHLWANGAIHFAAAIASFWILRRRGIVPVLGGAFGALAAACLLLRNPTSGLLASFLYPAGVSLYSVALVAYPSLLTGESSTEERGRRAGWLYAVAGWIGSGLGIGMGQNLGFVPVPFLAVAGAVILGPICIHAFRRHPREAAVVGAVALAAVVSSWTVGAHDTQPGPLSAVAKGRAVYISEGCIHCHSQYVRPGSADVLMWGPVEPIAEIRREEPPLIGNRRQGPDLAEVGARRSPLWLKAHLYNPEEVSGASIMPSYGFLFNDERGNDLVAYLESLRASDLKQQASNQQAWGPSADAWAHASAAEGAQLYAKYCATCHDAAGATRRRWHSAFQVLPIEFPHGPYRYLQAGQPPQQLQLQLARIAKFGIPGTDMPGHEYLPDRQITSLSLWLSQKIAQPNSPTNASRSIQEKNP